MKSLILMLAALTLGALDDLPEASVLPIVAPTIANSTLAVNAAPTVSAGPDRTITRPAATGLAGVADDDGEPGPGLTVAWSTVSGPGTVTFANAGAADTTASFSAAGIYVLRLTASDGTLTSTDTVVVNALDRSLPVYACVSIPGGAFSTRARYQELASAGFTQSLSGFSNVQEALAAMDAAEGTGVSVWVFCPELETDPANAISLLRHHPALAGYHIADEPSAAAFDALGARVRAIQAIDAINPCYINLLPIYASPALLGTATYEDHINQFISKVPVPILSFDHYATASGFLDQGLYTNLEIVSAAARGAGIPFWGFYMAVQETHRPPRTLAGLRIESFSNLVYGAQCVQAYTYWQTFSADLLSPIDRNGARTANYALVQTVNSDIQSLTRVFAGAQVIEVMHAGASVPTATRAFAPGRGIDSLDLGSGEAVVSFLRNGGADYVALVNKDILAPLPISLGFSAPGGMLEIRKDGSDLAVTSSSFSIAPGDILVFRFGNSAPTVELSVPATGTAGVPITMTATAADSDGSIVQVEFFVGAVSIGVDVSAPYEATWLLPGASLGYQLTAVATDDRGAITVSSPHRVDITAATAPPSGWSAQDIGASLAGATTYTGGTWTITGAGDDIWGQADGLHFASTQVTGDVQITARVTGLDATHAWAKAGVMIRESLSTGSRHAMTNVTPGNGLWCTRRNLAGATSLATAGPLRSVPTWVRMERIGNVLISSASSNGTTWRVIRRQTTSMGSTTYVGLAVTSHDPAVLCNATFTDVQVVSSTPADN